MSASARNLKCLLDPIRKQQEVETETVFYCNSIYVVFIIVNCFLINEHKLTRSLDEPPETQEGETWYVSKYRIQNLEQESKCLIKTGFWYLMAMWAMKLTMDQERNLLQLVC